MIADQRVRRREERRAVRWRELGADAEVAVQVGVDDDPSGQAQRAKNIAQCIHESTLLERQSGVSVNSSGNAVILANQRFA
jgi:hypothetical protein